MAVDSINLGAGKNRDTHLCTLFGEEPEELDIVMSFRHNGGNKVILGHRIVVLKEIFAIHLSDRRFVDRFAWLYGNRVMYFATALLLTIAVGKSDIAAVGTAEKVEVVCRLKPVGRYFFRRHLYDGEPLLGVGLIPHAVDITGTRSPCHSVALLFHIGEKVDIALIELFVWTVDFHTDSQRDFRIMAELDDIAVLFGLKDLFAILEIDVMILIFLVVLKGITIAGLGTLAAKACHFRSYHIAAEVANGIIAGDDAAVVGHGHGRDALN